MRETGTRVRVEDEPGRWCRDCGYELRGLPMPRCPECGRAFDLANPHTYRRRPIRRWLRRVTRTAIVVLTPILLLAATWGWLYWGWNSEQEAVRTLDMGSRRSTARVHFSSLLGPWPRAHLGRAGFVLDRATKVEIGYRFDSIDLAPVACLTRLQSVSIGNCAVRDLTPLTKLPRLQVLRIGESSVSDLTSLADLTRLQTLSITGKFGHMPFGVIPSPPVLPSLYKLSQLRELCLQDVTDSDLRPLSGLTSLERLELEDPALRDLAPLGGLVNLRVLMVRGKYVEDLGPLANLKKLRQLNIAVMRVKDLSSLAGLTELRELKLRYTDIKGIEPMADLTQLQKLDLAFTRVSDVGPLAKLTQLQELDLLATGVNDPSPLAGLTRLQSLNLYGTHITNVAPLAALTQLQTLDLGGTKVTNLAPLVTLTRLQSLRLPSKERVSEEDVDGLRHALPGCAITR